MLQLEPLLDRRAEPALAGASSSASRSRGRIVREPQAFLMDEPLTNLDAELRADMRAEIKHLQARLGDDHGLRHPRPARGDVARATGSRS